MIMNTNEKQKENAGSIILCCVEEFLLDRIATSCYAQEICDAAQLSLLEIVDELLSNKLP